MIGSWLFGGENFAAFKKHASCHLNTPDKKKKQLATNPIQ